MKKTNSIGLIGCGIWGQKILSTLISHNVDVTVFDISEVNKKQAIGLGATNFVVYEGSLSDAITPQLDGIIVATPSSAHADNIEQLLDFNIPLFIEKPLTTNLTDAKLLVEKAHSEVFMMHIWQYHPGINMLASIANTNQLGELLQVKTTRSNWTSPRTDTDTLWNFMSHDLSIFNSILGKIPKPIFAIAERHNNTIRDATVILGDQPHCVTHISNRSERKLREVRIHCSDGVATLKNDQDNHIEIIHGDDKSKSPVIEKIDFNNKSALELEVVAFLEYINGGSTPVSNLSDGLRIIEVIDEINKLTTTQL